MAKILVVEDNADLSSTLRDCLELEQHIVDVIADGKDALQLLSMYGYDVIILDIGLPGIDGVEVCKRFRMVGGSAQILMLTARSDIQQKAEGLDAGADDYLTKPFHMQELTARIRSLMRRAKTISGPELIVGNLVLNSATHQVTRDGEAIHLQRMEFALLEFLMRHPGQVFSGDALLDRVWPADADRSAQTMRALVKKLRDKLSTRGEPSIIKNVHGVGYKLEC